MTTERQIESNRLNAGKSTGPRTAEGKQVTRGNALRHGMAGAGVALPRCDEAAVRDRLAEWAPLFPQSHGLENWALTELVRATVRVDRCSIEESLVRTRAADRAVDLWDDDRALEVEKLGTKLGKQPEIVAKTLDQTVQGCAWKSNLWKTLAERVSTGQPWDDTHQTLALDLLGYRKEFRSGKTPLDSNTPDPLPEEVTQHRLTAINHEIARLEERMEGVLADADARDRQAVIEGYSVGLNANVNLIDRYLAAAHRRYDKAFKQIADAPTEKATARSVPPLPDRPIGQIGVKSPLAIAKEEHAAKLEMGVPISKNEAVWFALVNKMSTPAEPKFAGCQTNPVELADIGQDQDNETDVEQEFEPARPVPTTVSKASRPKMNRQQRRGLAKKRREADR